MGHAEGNRAIAEYVQRTGGSPTSRELSRLVPCSFSNTGRAVAIQRFTIRRSAVADSRGQAARRFIDRSTVTFP